MGRRQTSATSLLSASSSSSSLHDVAALSGQDPPHAETARSGHAHIHGKGKGKGKAEPSAAGAAAEEEEEEEDVDAFISSLEADDVELRFVGRLKRSERTLLQGQNKGWRGAGAL